MKSLLAEKSCEELIRVIRGLFEWCMGDQNEVYFEDALDAMTYALLVEFICSRGECGEVPDGGSLRDEFERLIGK